MILYLIGGLGCGGLEHQLRYLMTELHRRHVPVGIAVWNFLPDEKQVAYLEKLNLSCFIKLAPQWSLFKKTKILFDCLKTHPITLIHSYSFYLNRLAYFLSCLTSPLLGRPIISFGSVRSDYVSDIRETGFFWGRINALKPQHQIYNSYTALNHSQNWAGILSARHKFVVQNCVDLTIAKISAPKKRAIPKIVAVGSINKFKRYERLVEVACILKKRKVQCHIDIYGDGPLKNSLLDLIKYHQVEDYVEIKNRIENVFEILNDSNFFIHTAAVEGCPNVILEAMACARAIITTSAGDTPQLVLQNHNGFLIDPFDADKMANKVEFLCINYELQCTMGQASRQLAENKHSISHMTDSILEIYSNAGFKKI